MLVLLLPALGILPRSMVLGSRTRLAGVQTRLELRKLQREAQTQKSARHKVRLKLPWMAPKVAAVRKSFRQMAIAYPGLPAAVDMRRPRMLVGMRLGCTELCNLMPLYWRLVVVCTKTLLFVLASAVSETEAGMRRTV